MKKESDDRLSNADPWRKWASAIYALAVASGVQQNFVISHTGETRNGKGEAMHWLAKNVDNASTIQYNIDILSIVRKAGNEMTYSEALEKIKEVQQKWSHTQKA